MRRFRFVGDPSEYKRWKKTPVFNDIYDKEKHAEYYGSGSEAAWNVIDDHEDWQEVHENEGHVLTQIPDTTPNPLHKDTDLGAFSVMLCQMFSGNNKEPIPSHVAKKAIEMAQELIKQLDKHAGIHK